MAHGASVRLRRFQRVEGAGEVVKVGMNEYEVSPHGRGHKVYRVVPKRTLVAVRGEEAHRVLEHMAGGMR